MTAHPDCHTLVASLEACDPIAYEAMRAELLKTVVLLNLAIDLIDLGDVGGVNFAEIETGTKFAATHFRAALHSLDGIRQREARKRGAR